MRPLYETQLERKGGSWFLTIIITVLDNVWTSRPVMLDADTLDEARAEALGQLVALRDAMEGRS